MHDEVAIIGMLINLIDDAVEQMFAQNHRKGAGIVIGRIIAIGKGDVVV